MNSTAEYYQKNSQPFIQETISLDLDDLYTRFLKHLPSQGIILDAGCGSGRDSKAFQARGYSVVAFDACPDFVEYTKKTVQIPTYLMDFETLNLDLSFDGIWSCASLLHLPPKALTPALQRLAHHLKSEGYLYVSFKKGDFAGERHDRWFTDLTQTSLLHYLPTELHLIDYWETPDRRPHRTQEYWINAILCTNPH